MERNQTLVSIALATFNGERYVLQQLESFSRQTKIPSELVVVDDVSSDRTLDILYEFSKTAPFEVKIFCNDKNLGYVKNFERAISLCSGDIVFLSDQDDVWFADKIEKVCDALDENKYAQVAVCDQIVCDESLNHKGSTVLSNARRLGYGDAWFVAGCCTALRRDWINFVTPIPESIGGHDLWIGGLSDALGVRVLLDEPLQFYRRTSDSVSSSEAQSMEPASRLGLLKKYGFCDSRSGWAKEILQSASYRDRIAGNRDFLRGYISDVSTNASIERYSQRISSLEKRIAITTIPRFRRVGKIVNFWRNSGYSQFSGFKSAVKDLLRP